MPLNARIEDGKGRGTHALIEDDGVLTSVMPCPPMLPQMCRVFRQFLTDDGLATGDEDMGIDGSAVAVEFWVPADEDVDRYITTLSFSMTCGTQPQFWEFADSDAALANGCRLWYETTAETVYIHDAILDNWDLIRLCLGEPTISSGAVDDAFIVRHVGAANDWGMIPALDLRRLLPPFGIKLDRGTQQKLVFEIRDDCTDADVFNCIAYGFDRFE